MVGAVIATAILFFAAGFGVGAGVMWIVKEDVDLKDRREP